MASRIFAIVFLFFTCALWGQHSHPSKAEAAAIERAKNLQASSLDHALPDVTLDFLLQYEAEGAPVEWKVTPCSEVKSNPPAEHDATCVAADLDLKRDRSAIVIVSLGPAPGRPASGTPGKDAAGAASILSITVSDDSGGTRAVHRLSDLPMELHRPLPRSPRDLHLPSSAAAVPSLNFMDWCAERLGCRKDWGFESVGVPRFSPHLREVGTTDL